MRRLALLLAPLLVACASPDDVSIQEERRLGAQVAERARRELPLLHDPVVTGYVRALGEALVSRADTTGRRYEFHVVDAPQANAFAAPGGFIFVNRGLIELAGTEAELAGVLAHEIGHVVERHSLDQLTRERNANTIVSLVYTLLGRDPGMGEQIALGVAGAAWSARHSREAEREADQVGLEYLWRAGFDPQGMPAMFERLLSAERGEPGLVGQWFGTHPLTGERVAATDSLIALLPPSNRAERPPAVQPTFAEARARLAALPPPTAPTEPAPAVP